MNVLAIVAHPDDMECYCSGTLLKCAQRGDNVFVCNVSSGSLGHAVIPSEQLKKIREEESLNSCKIGGFQHIWAGFDDLNIFNDKKYIDRIAEIIKVVNPDFIITHAPNDYMPDHTNVSKSVFDASFVATIPQYPIKNGVVTQNPPIFYMDNDLAIDFNPSIYVDISDVIDKKKQMIDCHQSQVVWLREHDGIDFADASMTVSKLRGLQSGVKFAEGFRECKASGKLRAERLLP